MAAAQKLTDDPLEMTVRALLERLVANQQVDSDWVNVRGDQWPWRQLVAAAERGEVQVSRVGRKLMMRRQELDSWLSKHFIKKHQPGDLSAKDEDDEHVMSLIEGAGNRRHKRR